MDAEEESPAEFAAALRTQSTAVRLHELSKHYGAQLAVDALSLTVEPGVDVFNVFNSKNLRRPEVTNLIFNFDGTVQSGVGDPRQVQVGVRVLF